MYESSMSAETSSLRISHGCAAPLHPEEGTGSRLQDVLRLMKPDLACYVFFF